MSPPIKTQKDKERVISQKTWDTALLVMFLLISLLFTASLLQWLTGGQFPLAFGNLAQRLLNIIFGVTVILMIVVLVLENDNPVHTLAWILVLLYLPVVGFIFYLFFGRNWRKTRLFNRKGLADAVNLHELWPPNTSPHCVSQSVLAGRLIDLLDSNSKAILTCQNNVEIIPDTSDALDRICADIEAAQHHVHLEYFSVAPDETGRRIKELLIRKVREGVQVRFIYDDVGCFKLGRAYKKKMREAGVEFIPFMPVWIPLLNSRANYRNHRKIVIVDGTVGYLGGLNIGDKYMGLSKYYGYWRDSVVRIDGEGAVTLQALFLTDWFFVSKQNLLTRELFSQYVPKKEFDEEALDNIMLQVVASGPDTDHASIMQAYFLAISNARRSIRIVSPYLILNESLLTALKTAALSGVKIQILLPGKPDHLIVWWGGRSYFRELMEVGIEIYEYKNGFLHAKELIVDDEVISIGTANMDLRSFNHNFEATAMIYHQPTVAAALKQFYDDLDKSQRIDKEIHQQRSILTKTMESICRLFSPVL